MNRIMYSLEKLADVSFPDGYFVHLHFICQTDVQEARPGSGVWIGQVTTYFRMALGAVITEI
jgi:hypothetical protein